jgi:hypothetical protein
LIGVRGTVLILIHLRVIEPAMNPELTINSIFAFDLRVIKPAMNPELTINSIFAFD